MIMQEPEQWQEDQQYGAYRAKGPDRYEQKIYPQEERNMKGIVLVRIASVLSWIALFFTIPGIVASAIVLKYAHGQQSLVTAGVMGLVSSILALGVFIAIFVLSTIVLVKQKRLCQAKG